MFCFFFPPTFFCVCVCHGILYWNKIVIVNIYFAHSINWKVRSMFYTYYLIYLHKNTGGRCYCLHFPGKGTNTQMLKNMCEVTQLGRGGTGMGAPAIGVRAGETQTGHSGCILQMCFSPLCPTRGDKMNRKSGGCCHWSWDRMQPRPDLFNSYPSPQGP